jgi:hypothetical protein
VLGPLLDELQADVDTSPTARRRPLEVNFWKSMLAAQARGAHFRRQLLCISVNLASAPGIIRRERAARVD